MRASEVGRRVRAARVYAGYSRVEDLAEQVGIGRSTLLAIERGERSAKRWELVAIAELCGVPRGLLTSPAEEIHAALSYANGTPR